MVMPKTVEAKTAKRKTAAKWEGLKITRRIMGTIIFRRPFFFIVDFGMQIWS